MDHGEDSESHADRLFAFLRMWGLAETALDLCNARILAQLDGRLPRSRFPVTLEKKLEYYLDAHRELVELAPFLEQALHIRTLFNSEKELRNTIVHGSPLDHEDDGTVHFLQLRPHRGEPRYRYRKVTPQDWDRLEEVSIELFWHLLVSQKGLINILHRRALAEGYVTPKAGLMALPGDLPLPRRIREFLDKALLELPLEQPLDR